MVRGAWCGSFFTAARILARRSTPGDDGDELEISPPFRTVTPPQLEMLWEVLVLVRSGFRNSFSLTTAAGWLTAVARRAVRDEFLSIAGCVQRKMHSTFTFGKSQDLRTIEDET